MIYAIPTEPAQVDTVWDKNGNRWEKVKDRYWETGGSINYYTRKWKDLVFHHGPLTAVKPVKVGDVIHPDCSSEHDFRQNTVVVTDKNRAYQYIENRWHDPYGLKFDDLENFTGDRVTVIFVP